MQFLAALQVGLRTLEELGMVLPTSLTPEEIQAAFAETAEILADRQIQDLIHLPAMTNPIMLWKRGWMNISST